MPLFANLPESGRLPSRLDPELAAFTFWSRWKDWLRALHVANVVLCRGAMHMWLAGFEARPIEAMLRARFHSANCRGGLHTCELRPTKLSSIHSLLLLVGATGRGVALSAAIWKFAGTLLPATTTRKARRISSPFPRLRWARAPAPSRFIPMTTWSQSLCSLMP